MSTRLVLLGLLKDKSLHGYELKRIIEENMGDWTNIAFGSIYFALNKLKQEGYVVQISEEKVGNRPSRSIYQITEKGRNEFLHLLRDIWQKYERAYFPLDIALAFSNALPEDEIKSFLKNRILRLENILFHLAEHKNEQLANPRIPASAKLVFSHAEYHNQAELLWLKEVLLELEKGILKHK